jgi:hypothetical protein
MNPSIGSDGLPYPGGSSVVDSMLYNKAFKEAEEAYVRITREAYLSSDEYQILINMRILQSSLKREIDPKYLISSFPSDPVELQLDRYTTVKNVIFIDAIKVTPDKLRFNEMTLEAYCDGVDIVVTMLVKK